MWLLLGAFCAQISCLISCITFTCYKNCCNNCFQDVVNFNKIYFLVVVMVMCTVKSYAISVKKIRLIPFYFSVHDFISSVCLAIIFICISIKTIYRKWINKQKKERACNEIGANKFRYRFYKSRTNHSKLSSLIFSFLFVKCFQFKISSLCIWIFLPISNWTLTFFHDFIFLW